MLLHVTECQASLAQQHAKRMQNASATPDLPSGNQPVGLRDMDGLGA